MKDLILEDCLDETKSPRSKFVLTASKYDADLCISIEYIRDGLSEDVLEMNLTEQQVIQLANYLDKVLNLER